jgi:hypothetical protein
VISFPTYFLYFLKLKFHLQLLLIAHPLTQSVTSSIQLPDFLIYFQAVHTFHYQILHFVNSISYTHIHTYTSPYLLPNHNATITSHTQQTTPYSSSIHLQPRPLPLLFTTIKSRPHIHHTSNTITLLHIIKGLIDTLQWLAMGDELIDLEFTFQVIVDESG